MRTIFQMARKFSLSLVICVSALTTACSGGEDQQDGQLLSTTSTSTPPAVNSLTMVNGLVMNGYLANALVWIDLKDNGTLDGFEPFAYTDNQGYFSYNPVSGENYCRSGQEAHKRFCLETSVTKGDVIVRATKGVELLSGESFQGLITNKVSVASILEHFDTLSSIGPKPLGDDQLWQQNVNASLIKISPLSSLVYHLPEDTSLTAALDNLGLTTTSSVDVETLTSDDYIAGLTKDSASSNALFIAASTISGMVDVISSNLDEAAVSGNKNLDLGIDGLPVSSADMVYAALAEVLSSASFNTPSNAFFNIEQSTAHDTQIETLSKDVSNNLANTLLEKAIDKFAHSLLSVDDDKLVDGDKQAIVNRLNQLKGNTLIIDQTNGIFTITHSHINENNDTQASDTDANNTQARLLGANLSINLVTTNDKIAFQSSNKAAAIITLVEYLAAPQNPISEAFTQQSQDKLNSPDENTSVLSQNIDLFSFNDSLIATIEDDGNLSSLSQDNVEPTALVDIDDNNGSIWVNNALSLSGVHDQNEQGQVIAFFNADINNTIGANAGELRICVAYINPKDPKDNITGALFEGTWSAIGGNQNRLSLVAEGFTVQMKILGESLGRDISSEQQVNNLQRLPSESYGKFSFTLNNDSAIWHSDDSSINENYGLRAYTKLPENNDDCQTMLRLQP